jgi:hypothetical protein
MTEDLDHKPSWELSDLASWFKVRSLLPGEDRQGAMAALLLLIALCSALSMHSSAYCEH